mmetsp:Transcript_36041/g.82777  ORF Transcript_36041/g.82777 Transcript_36041/m.82777 type:complete len:233 (+) Transcript_36041:72-770(+)
MCLGLPAENVREIEVHSEWAEVPVDEASPLLTAAARRRVKQRLRRKMDKQQPPDPEQLTLSPSMQSVAGQHTKNPAMSVAPLASLRSAKVELEVTKTEAPILASFAPTALGTTMLVPICALPIVMPIEEKPLFAGVDGSCYVVQPKQLPVQEKDALSTEDDHDGSTDAFDNAAITTSGKSSSNDQPCLELSEFRFSLTYTVRKTFVELDDGEDVVLDFPRKRASSAPPMQQA